MKCVINDIIFFKKFFPSCLRGFLEENQKKFGKINKHDEEREYTKENALHFFTKKSFFTKMGRRKICQW